MWQLQGLDVFVGGEQVGRVRDVHHTNGGDLLEIARLNTRSRDADLFVPFHDASIVEVDVDGGRLVLTAEAVAQDDE